MAREGYFAFRTKSTKTRIETITANADKDTRLPAFRTKSTKTRIETRCPKNHGCGGYVHSEQNPLKQGLKLHVVSKEGTFGSYIPNKIH